MKQTRMKSFVEQSERHYVSVPRHHLWSRIYIILRVLVFFIYVACKYLYAFPCVCTCMAVLYVRVSVYYDTLSLSFSLIFSLIFSHFSLVSFRSFFIFTLFFSRPFAACTLTHVLPARLSLPLCLTF